MLRGGTARGAPGAASSSGQVPLVDRPLPRGKGEVALSLFAFLFSEMVQYAQKRSSNIGELEGKLEAIGMHAGYRLLELLTHRDRGNKRETRILGVLSFIHTPVWKCLFGKPADSLEQGNDAEDEYMISDHGLLVNRFISVPKDMGSLNCGAYVAGIVKGVLEASGFPARVTAHFVGLGDGTGAQKTVILIKFAEAVLERERRMGA